MESDEKKPIFNELHAEEDSTAPVEIESLCFNCKENGITKLLLTKIPHFKEIILMAFECPHCGYRNNEIQSGSSIAPRGVKYVVSVQDEKDLSRQVVKQETASLTFQEIDFEIPPSTQKGQLNTIEGFLLGAIDNLTMDQEARKVQHPELWEKIEKVIKQLQDAKDLKFQFNAVLDDPAGNSYLENLCAPDVDPKLNVSYYKRSPEQSLAVGLDPENDKDVDEMIGDPVTKDEIFNFASNCSHCKSPCATKMKVVDIPYFKEVVIMATNCDICGYRSNEVKAGGAISEKGKRISLRVTDSEDLSRDILKSESCGLSIPELELELEPGTLGGKFTTVEGLLQSIHDELYEKSPFSKGDSSVQDKREKLMAFLDRLNRAIRVEIPYTLILDDPLGNSYLQNLYAPDPDPNMTIELYERSWELNEFLGLNDMNT